MRAPFVFVVGGRQGDRGLLDVFQGEYKLLIGGSRMKGSKAVFCLIGASGVGKGTILKLILAEFGTSFGFSVSHTTRRRRRGEVDGVDYNFVTSEEMKEGIKGGKFAEHAQVHGNLYGTSFLRRAVGMMSKAWHY